MIIVERGWHFPPSRDVKSFSKVYSSPSMAFRSYDYNWERPSFSVLSLRRAVFRTLHWLVKFTITAERGWHFPPCRYAKSFSKVWEGSLTALRNYDYRWEGVTFSSLSLCQVVVKSVRELLGGTQKLWLLLRGVDIFLLVAMPNRFQKYGRALRRHSETMIIAERGSHFPLCRYARSFSKVWGNFWAAPRNYDYSWEGLTFPSLLLCQIVFKSMRELFDGTRKLWL